MKAQEDPLFLDRLQVRFGPRAEQFSDELLETLHALWRDGELHGAGVMCDRCGKTEGVKIRGAMTAYVQTEGELDRNHPTPFCPECSEEYVEYWQAMWDEYHSGLM